MPDSLGLHRLLLLAFPEKRSHEKQASECLQVCYSNIDAVIYNKVGVTLAAQP